jgi:competence ComEA-like helix-hairpin-helix protein
MGEARLHPVEVGRAWSLQEAQALAFVVSVGICLALSLLFAVVVFGPSSGPPRVEPGERINPNDAPVPSLIRLSQVGLARAQAIGAHRDRAGQEPTFRTADDLQQIRGIGSAIVEDMRPWLQFDDPPPDSNDPSGR